MKHLNDLLRQIKDESPVNHETLTKRLNKGGFRSLFDPFCYEWDESSIEEKVEILRLLMQYTEFHVIVELWKCTERRAYIQQDLPAALQKLALHLPEAAAELKLKIYEGNIW